MAESLSTEQIEERRTNLRAFRTLLMMEDDSHLTTTLLMQEEWLATVDELQTYVRDAHIIRGLRTRKCLRGTGGLALECQDCYDDIAEYCAPCYLRAIHLTPEMREGIREGVQAVNEGRIRPWSEVEAEIFENMPLPATSIRVDPDAFAPIPLHEDEPRSRPTDITELELRYISMDFDSEECEVCHDNGTVCSCGDERHVPCQGNHVVTACGNCQGDEEPTHAHAHSHDYVHTSPEHAHYHPRGHHNINFFGGVRHGPR